MIAAREGDFLESVEGLFFDVKGDCHPPDRVISYVRYVPDVRGDRKKEGRVYRKIYDLKERSTFLREYFPHYVYFDPVFQRKLQGVPLERVRRMYYPREKLAELVHAEERDVLQENTVQLSQGLGLPVETVGVSGSVLVGLHTAGSDVDLVVYGREYCVKGYERLKTLRERGVLQEFDSEEACKKAQFRWGFASDELVRLEQKKVLHGLFQEKEYFVRLLKEEYMRYGDVQYVPLGKARLTAVITDDTEGIFTPCCYEIEDSSVEGVSKLVSLRGRFCEQVKKGDTVTARGTVEKVVTRDGEFYQMMLGDAGDYLLPREC